MKSVEFSFFGLLPATMARCRNYAMSPQLHQQAPQIIRSICFLVFVIAIYICSRYMLTDGVHRKFVGAFRQLQVSGEEDGSADDQNRNFSIFGAISDLGIFIGTISIILTVIALNMVDSMFYFLHKATNDTPFHKMVSGIEKELMIAGFTAFAYKIFVETTNVLSLDWFQALGYADILVPIFTSAYCALGMMLILNSIQISTMWSQAYHLELSELLNTYYCLPGFLGYFPYGLALAPFTPTIARVEFRIFQSIFCQTYKIQKNAFAFNEYVEKVFEKFVLVLIKIRTPDWCMLCALVLLNWARNALNLDYQHCRPGDFECAEESALVMFTISGAIILFLTVLLALESRRLEVRIMAQKGICSVHAYPAYLKYMEESAEAKALDAFRLNKDELKASAEAVKYNAMQQGDAVEGEQVPGGAPGVKNGNGGNKFSASVTQAWKTKKNVSKGRRRSVTALSMGRLGARRQSLMGGSLMGLGGESESAIKLREFLAQMQTRKAATISEGDEESSSSSSSSGSSSSHSSGGDSGSEEFDGSARDKKKKKPVAMAQQQENKSHDHQNVSRASFRGGGNVAQKGEAGGDGDGDGDGSDDGSEEESRGRKGGGRGEEEELKQHVETNTCTAAPAPVGRRTIHSSMGMGKGMGASANSSSRPLPNIDFKNWKAAPAKPSKLAHVFTRLQKHMEAMAPQAQQQNQEQEQEEEQGVSDSHPWGAAGEPISVQLKPKLPPISLPSKSSSIGSSSGKGGGIRPGHIFGRTVSKYSIIHSDDQAAAEESPSCTTATDATPSAVNIEGFSSRTNLASSPLAATITTKTKLPPIKSVQPSSLTHSHDEQAPQSELNAQVLFNSKISPARSSRKTISPGKAPAEQAPVAAGALAKEKSVKFSDISAPPSEKTAEKKHKESLVPPPIGSLKYTPVMRSGGADVFGEEGNPNPNSSASTPVAAASLASTPFPIVRLPRLSGVSSPAAEEEEETPIVDVFFLSWPELYLEGVQALIMVISLYFSLFFTNFVAAAGAPGLKVLAILPAVICSVLLIYIVKCAVMLSAIHAVDCDAILEVLEQTEGAAVLGALIKQKVIALMQVMGTEPYEQLVNLFAQIDADGSGSISRDEFAEYMNSIEIHFDRRRWMQVFRGIDTTFDNMITFEEFFLFLFPDHEFGQGLKEKKNLAVQSSLMIKSQLRAEYLRRHNQTALMTYVPRKTVAEEEQANAARKAEAAK